MAVLKLKATSKTAPTDLNRKNVFFQKLNGGFIYWSSLVKIRLYAKYQLLTRNLKICGGHPNNNIYIYRKLCIPKYFLLSNFFLLSKYPSRLHIANLHFHGVANDLWTSPFCRCRESPRLSLILQVPQSVSSISWSRHHLRPQIRPPRL